MEQRINAQAVLNFILIFLFTYLWQISTEKMFLTSGCNQGCCFIFQDLMHYVVVACSIKQCIKAYLGTEICKKRKQQGSFQKYFELFRESDKYRPEANLSTAFSCRRLFSEVRLYVSSQPSFTFEFSLLLGSLGKFATYRSPLSSGLEGGLNKAPCT